MQSRLVHEAHGQRTFVAVLQTGDEVMENLKRLAKEERLSAAQITAIGAFSHGTLAYFDWERKEYQDIPVDEQIEVAALVGDVALDQDGAPALHIHLVLGKRDGTAVAGHLVEAYVRPTLEVVLTETPAHLRRVKDPETGLMLIQPNKSRPAPATSMMIARRVACSIRQHVVLASKQCHHLLECHRFMTGEGRRWTLPGRIRCRLPYYRADLA